MIAFLASLALVMADDDFDLGSSSNAKVTHKMFHSYDGLNWEERGVIQITSFGDKRRKPQVSVKNHKFEKEKLKNAENYYVRVDSSHSNNFFIQSSVPACYLFGSDLQDVITILYDVDSESISALNYKTEGKTCQKSSTALKLQTMAEILSTKEAIKPYFAPPKIETHEEKSFFSKYVKVI
jgi:ribosomal protein S30